jgi:hypothetical protein
MIDLNIKYIQPVIKIVKKTGRPIQCRICYKYMLPEERYVFFRTRSKELLTELKIQYRQPHITICIECWKTHKVRIENLLGIGYEPLSIEEEQNE